VFDLYLALVSSKQTICLSLGWKS